MAPLAVQPVASALSNNNQTAGNIMNSIGSMKQVITDQNNLPSQALISPNQFFSGSHHTPNSQSVNSFCVGGQTSMTKNNAVSSQHSCNV